MSRESPVAVDLSSPRARVACRRAGALLCASLLRLIAPAIAAAQGDPPVLKAVAVGQAPTIDGQLDDAVWAGADITSDFRQRDPAEGRSATESTRVRVVYDKTSLYIGVELDDSDASLVRATELRRDNALESDDSFAVLLDTYHDRRNAFFFRVNPRGTRFDGLVRNESKTIDAVWDEEWRAAATLTERGWVAELAIPFKILRFRADDGGRWGINFERIIKHKNELVYWAGWSRDFAFTHVSQAGQLTGLTGISQAERLRVRPYVVLGAESLAAASPPRSTAALREVGLDDLKLAVTSNLTADLTIHPDFAQAEVDAQRVNLTRFSLFFPERRQFFVEGSDSLRMGIDTLDLGGRLLELVYTRSIGLSATGQPIPIIAGAKLTGKTAGFDLGVLQVNTAESGGTPGEHVAVARVRKELLGRSYVGAIVTDRRSGGLSNRVFGSDARFVVRKHLTVLGLLAASTDDGVAGTRWAGQLGAEWLSDLFLADLTYAKIEQGFTPAAGYVRRHDRLLGGRVAVKPRPDWPHVRQLEIAPYALAFHDGQGVLQTGERGVTFATIFQSGERLGAKVDTQAEYLADPFEISAGVVLAPRRYQWTSGEISFETFEGRRISGRVEANLGHFYTGTQGSYEFALDFRPGPHFSVESSYELNDVDLREGAFHTHLIGVKSNVSFTKALLASVYAQYNSTGSLAALQMRLNYIFRTIDNFYLVYNETRLTQGPLAGRSNRSLVAKVTYSVHR